MAKHVKPKVVSQWLGIFTVAVILAGIISIVSSFADFLNVSNLTMPASSITLINSSVVEAKGCNLSKFVLDYKPKKYLTDAQLLVDATDACPRAGTPRIAFLFIVRGDIPHEPVWRRFFKNQEEKYSLYAHATPGYVFPNGSLFEGREIPSLHSPRFSRGIVDALRRLLAQALLDPRYNNAWFVNACETTVPIRGFPFAYEYLMRSHVSFVESFFPDKNYQNKWDTLPEFNASELRKGELWMALHRDHARVVVSDTEIYFAFTARCTLWCTWDEQYVQTLLHLRVGRGIAERTVMYVNWTGPHDSSPNWLLATKIKDLQSRTRDTDGERHDTAFDNTTYACQHNGVAPSPCFLFARKFDSSQTKALLSLEPQELGY